MDMHQFIVDQDACIQCGECVADCLLGCLEMGESAPHMTEDGAKKCIACQHCLAVCPTGAVSVAGRTPEQCEEFAGRLPAPQSLLLLMKARRSVRRYKQEAVEPEILDMLMEGLASAPTGVNNRGLLFHLVRDPAVMERIRQDARMVIRGILEEYGQSAIPERYLRYMRGLVQGQDPVFRGAPHMLVVTVRKDAPCANADPFIAMSYFELLANSLGLGTVWCGVAVRTLFELAPALGKKLGVPDDQQLGYIMMFGKPDVTYHRTVERGPANTREITWED